MLSLGFLFLLDGNLVSLGFHSIVTPNLFRGLFLCYIIPMSKHNMQLLQELSLKNGPLCVGLDTDPSYIPENIINQYESPAAAVLAYNKAIIDRVVADKSACC